MPRREMHFSFGKLVGLIGLGSVPTQFPRLLTGPGQKSWQPVGGRRVWYQQSTSAFSQLHMEAGMLPLKTPI